MKSFEELQRQLSEGRMERRDFIKRATALGMAAAIPTALLAEEAKAAAPKQGGTLRQALRGGATSDSLDGATLLDTHGINTSWQIRNNLTEVTAEGEVVGELAESWEASDDAAEWVFTLRKSVEFHNGKSLEAQDVIDSINHHRGPDSKSGASGVVAPITDLKADGKDKVVFTLESGVADLPYLVADYHLIIAPAGTKDSGWDEGIGTGPYVLTEWEPGIRSSGKRNPNYFKEGRPYFDEVQSLNIADAAARANALQTDEVDTIEDPDLKTLHMMERIPGIVIKEAGGTKHFSYPMLSDQAPFDNNDVRLALKYGVDREALLKTVLRGHGYLGNDHPIGQGQRYFAKDLEQRQYDPDKAKHHLKKAGLDSLAVPLFAADIYNGGVDAAVLYKEHASKAGIDIEVKRVPTDGYWSEIWLKKPWCVCYWSGRATEDWMFSTAYAADAAWNDMNWKDPRFNELLVAARAELDNAKRRTMYYEMQEIVRDEGAVVIPVFANWVVAVTDKLGTPDVLAGNWNMDGDKNTERWWFS